MDGAEEVASNLVIAGDNGTIGDHACRRYIGQQRIGAFQIVGFRGEMESGEVAQCIATVAGSWYSSTPAAAIACGTLLLPQCCFSPVISEGVATRGDE